MAPVVSHGQDTRTGVLYTGGAFLFWGLAPLYWKQLESLPATEVLAHRIAWSLPCLALLIAWRGRWREVRSALGVSRTRVTLLATTLLIGGNWFTFIWAVNNGHVLDASLGYYINPLVSVLLGYLCLGERLRRPQWLSLGLAAAGVAILTSRHGLPWISLVLASTFALYGLLRKIVAAQALTGLFIEVAILAPIAGAHLLRLHHGGQGAFASGDLPADLVLACAGPVTAAPLLMFTHGARRLTLASVGFLQYLTPTGHFLLAVACFGEAFTATHLAAFACIWTALALYSADLHRQLTARG